MAYNPNIPAPDNLVQDDIAAIRENFQHLDPLAQAVDDLQAVSELAPVVEELQAVSELAPYLQAILDSRIVEMGTNSNGTYVRWENGLQVCWIDEAVASFLDRFALRYHWVYPAGFAAPPAVASTKYSPFEFNETNVPSGDLIRNLIGPYLREKSGVFVRLDLANSLGDWTGAENKLKLSAFAIGRWK